MKTRLRSFEGTTVAELQEWIRRYALYGPHPAPPAKRFAIGFYQIWQAMAWTDKINKYESLAAAAVHFWSVAELLDLQLEYAFPRYVEEIGKTRLCADQLLLWLSRAQQNVIYSAHPPAIKRGSRYDRVQLQTDLSQAVYMLLGGIPKEVRGEALTLATHIMTGSL